MTYMPDRIPPCWSNACRAFRVIIQKGCAEDDIWIGDRQHVDQHVVHRIQALFGLKTGSRDEARPKDSDGTNSLVFNQVYI